MHTESCPSVKLSGELGISSTPNNSTVLEDDLALSSSTLGQQDKCHRDYPEVTTRLYHLTNNVVYVNEDTMDCSYPESSGTPRKYGTRIEVSSPEMFESDDEEDEKKGHKDFKEFLPQPRDKSSSANSSIVEKCVEPTIDELIAKSDCYLLARMNKFLTGVPPPPKHTICQSDCGDLLACIRENREYFLVDPLPSVSEKMTNIDEKTTMKEKIVQNQTYGRSFNNHRGKSSLRNLTNAFNACDRNDESTIMTTTSVEDVSTRELCPDDSNDCRTSVASTDNDVTIDETRKNGEIGREASLEIRESSIINVTRSEILTNRDKARHVSFKMPHDGPIVRFYSTTNVEDVKNLPWHLAYRHKTHGIHYNRSKNVEEFESLTTKLCQRYIGAETQSSCNIWFTKQTPGSIKKRNLLLRRNNGQSPGKRLSHLARRRRTFSSANLQGLGMADKKQLVLNIKKPIIRKGKSPRGKSPRGKSPRGKSPRGKSPRGSAKKRAGLSRVSPSPRKSKLETSKRALFQSPPGDRAGPSRSMTLATTNSQNRIRRALFSTSKTKDDVVASASSVGDIKRVLSFDETRKRKSEDDLEGSRFKRVKSFNIDCAQGNENNSADSWTSEKHTIGGFHAKSETPNQQGKCELSDTHRKKLYWAVAEALRSKGIGMGHPRFKQCASQLAQTVKKYMPDLDNRNVPRKPGSTSDRMLRLAKLHVLLIVETKSAE